MKFIKDKCKRNSVLTVLSVVLIFAVAVGGCAVYLGDYYRTDNKGVAAFLPQGTSWETEPDGDIVFEPEGATKGLIFYPGGKVEYTAYIPLMQSLSEKGILCVLVEMPFNLAVFDMNGADGIKEQYPEIDEWYIGGHSLGGAMAASYLSEHTEEFEGLILLGAYSTADLSHSDIDVLSVYGSEDKVMDMGKYEENKTNLPEDFKEVIIDGGCHAYFGMYGAQDGDGIPTLTNEEQIYILTEYVDEMIN